MGISPLSPTEVNVFALHSVQDYPEVIAKSDVGINDAALEAELEEIAGVKLDLFFAQAVASGIAPPVSHTIQNQQKQEDFYETFDENWNVVEMPKRTQDTTIEKYSASEQLTVSEYAQLHILFPLLQIELTFLEGGFMASLEIQSLLKSIQYSPEMKLACIQRIAAATSHSQAFSTCLNYCAKLLYCVLQKKLPFFVLGVTVQMAKESLDLAIKDHLRPSLPVLLEELQRISPKA